jgi:hypothetical protein
MSLKNLGTIFLPLVSGIILFAGDAFATMCSPSVCAFDNQVSCEAHGCENWSCQWSDQFGCSLNTKQSVSKLATPGMAAKVDAFNFSCTGDVINEGIPPAKIMGQFDPTTDTGTADLDIVDPVSYTFHEFKGRVQMSIFTISNDDSVSYSLRADNPKLDEGELTLNTRTKSGELSFWWINNNHLRCELVPSPAP